MKVLLVDDEAEFLDLMAKRLERRGVRVVCASGGEDALALLAGDGEGGDGLDVDVVVLDVKMPGMDGLEVLRRMAAMPGRPEVVLLTGHASTEAAMQGMEMGAFDYLVKPVALNDLLALLQDAVRRGGLAGRE